jgi:AcrR family transcriptional regulator
MGTKQRRERERQQLRDSILAAAREIAARDGWQAVTMRRVAELIEYSPPTIYEYFESKDDILQELVGEGFRKLLAGLRTAYASTDDSQERMVRLALAYCNFAWSNPELYQVMHGMGGAACNMAEHPPEFGELGTILTGAAREALGMSPEDNADLSIALDLHMATMHGLVSLSMEGMLSGNRERATTLVKRSVRDWLAAWRRTG